MRRSGEARFVIALPFGSRLNGFVARGWSHPFAELGDEVGALDGLGEEVGGADVGEAVDGFHGGVAGEDDERGLCAEEVSEALGEDEAADIGEMDVDDCGVGAFFGGVSQGGEAGVEGGDVEACVGENGAEGAGDEVVVIDDENRAGLKRCLARNIAGSGFQNGASDLWDDRRWAVAKGRGKFTLRARA